MSARRALPALAALLLFGCATASLQDPRPAAVGELLAQCQGKEGWSDPAPPVRIFGNVYDVGTCGVVALLVTSDQGHILIDGATAAAAPLVAANIERLGFRLSDVEVLLNSHEHLDHAGGLAELQRRTGARLYALPAARQALESGNMAPDDPQLGLWEPYPPARVDRLLADGEVVRLGPLQLTAHATPAHSPGSTSWTWRSCEGERCVSVAFADSLTPAAADTYRFSDHPDRVASFRQGLAKVAALPCDLMITPHPGASRLFDRLSGKAPLIDLGACRAYAERAQAMLDERLAKEQVRSAGE